MTSPAGTSASRAASASSTSRPATDRAVTVGGIVLAGGRSTRMGEDKALLDWEGVPLVVHVCEQVRRAVDGPLVVVAAEGQALPGLDGSEVVTDLEPDRGPLEGLRTGLAALAPRADVAFVTSVDA